MEIFSHILWPMMLFRNKLWREEALFFAILPDVSFLLIMGYVLLGTPMDVNWNQAMYTMPAFYKNFYFLMHSFVTLGIVALIVWRVWPKLLPALSGWFLHICMDIPMHDGEFATRFLYPILPDFYISGLYWTDYRVLPIAYLLLLNFTVYSLWRERKKFRMGRTWKTDWIDKTQTFIEIQYNKIPMPENPIGIIINKKLTSTAHAARRNIHRTFEKLPGKNQDSTGQGED